VAGPETRGVVVNGDVSAPVPVPPLTFGGCAEAEDNDSAASFPFPLLALTLPPPPFLLLSDFAISR
jgi:hypothetical protein